MTEKTEVPITDFEKELLRFFDVYNYCAKTIFQTNNEMTNLVKADEPVEKADQYYNQLCIPITIWLNTMFTELKKAASIHFNKLKDPKEKEQARTAFSLLEKKIMARNIKLKKDGLIKFRSKLKSKTKKESSKRSHSKKKSKRKSKSKNK